MTPTLETVESRLAFFDRLGFSYFALTPNSKKPAGSWDVYQQRRPDQREKSNWMYLERRNYGIVTGGISGGLYVLDLDPEKMDSSADVYIHRWPTGFCVRTASGGVHLGYILPEGVQARNSTDKLAAGVDTRGEGGYIVAPGSQVVYYGDDARKKGVRSGYIGSYELIGDGQPAPMPADLLTLLAEHGLIIGQESRQERPQRDFIPSDVSEGHLSEILAYIPAEGSYDHWLTVIMGVHSVLPDQRGINLLNVWWPEDRPGLYAEKFKSLDKEYTGEPITIGTLIHLARQRGYIPPTADPLLRMGIPAESDPVLAGLQDAAEYWETLSGELSNKLTIPAAGDQASRKTPQILGSNASATTYYTQSSERWPDWSEGLLFGWLSVMCAVGGLNTGLIFYLVVTGQLQRGFTVGDVVAQSEEIGLPVTPKMVRTVLNSDAGQTFFPFLEGIESLEYIDSPDSRVHSLSEMGKNPQGGRPKACYSLAKPQVIHDKLLSLGMSKMTKWASTGEDFKRLPVYWRRDFLQPLLDESDNIDAVLSGLQQLTEQAKEQDPSFAKNLATFYARYRQGMEWINDRLLNSDLITALDLDPSADDAPAYVLGAGLLNYDYEQDPDQKHTYAYDQWLTGVSDVQRVRKAAKLRYRTGDKPREFVNIPLCDPEKAAEKVTRAARYAAGKPLKIWLPDSERAIPYTESNLAGVMARAARREDATEIRIKVELSVSAPLERYDPAAAVEAADQEQQTPVQQQQTPMHPQQPADQPADRSQRIQSKRQSEADDYFTREDALESLGETLKAVGWQIEADSWVDPEYEVYPAHFETVLAAATGVQLKNMLVRGRDYIVTGDGQIDYLSGQQGNVIEARARPVPVTPAHSPRGELPYLGELTRPTIFTRRADYRRG